MYLYLILVFSLGFMGFAGYFLATVLIIMPRQNLNMLLILIGVLIGIEITLICSRIAEKLSKKKFKLLDKILFEVKK